MNREDAETGIARPTSGIFICVNLPFGYAQGREPVERRSSAVLSFSAWFRRG